MFLKKASSKCLCSVRLKFTTVQGIIFGGISTAGGMAISALSNWGESKSNLQQLVDRFFEDNEGIDNTSTKVERIEYYQGLIKAHYNPNKSNPGVAADRNDFMEGMKSIFRLRNWPEADLDKKITRFVRKKKIADLHAVD
ncbi:hypothetical protein N9N03_01545 [Chlamydiia bacterium]|nr:hypothetical protein [Chlamydiia bacterium]